MRITISGLSGTGKSTIARIIAERLNYKRYSAGDFFRELLKERGLTVEDLSTFDKEQLFEIDRECDVRTKELDQKEDNYVIDGRIVGYFIPSADIKLWVFCDNNIVAERVSKRENIDFEEAKKNLKKRDDADNKRYKELYGINPQDNKYYNYIVDTSNLTIEDYELVVDDIINKVELLKKGEKFKFKK